jgi:hypothetical protein
LSAPPVTDPVDGDVGLRQLGSAYLAVCTVPWCYTIAQQYLDEYCGSDGAEHLLNFDVSTVVHDAASSFTSPFGLARLA